MKNSVKISILGALLSLASAQMRKPDAAILNAQEQDRERILDMKRFAYAQRHGEDQEPEREMSDDAFDAEVERVSAKKQLMLEQAAAFSEEKVNQLTLAHCTSCDQRYYPDFAKAMRERGGNLAWKSHAVLTDDGYLLRMFRIIGSHSESERAQKYRQEKGPLLLIHGLASDSITWFSQKDEYRDE